MPDINQLKSSFFIDPADTDPTGSSVPATYADSKITPLIDVSAYNPELKSAMALATGAGDFIYIADWLLGLAGGSYTLPGESRYGLGFEFPPTQVPKYHLDQPNGSEALIDLLAQKAAAGVDVRVMGWMSTTVTSNGQASSAGVHRTAHINAMTMQSIYALRQIKPIHARAILNTIGHPAGDIKCSLVIAGNANESIGFTGSLSPEEKRWGRPGHHGVPGPDGYPDLAYQYHGVMAKVEGPAVQGLYDLFQQMWAENLSRPPKSFKFFHSEDRKWSLPLLSYLPESTPALAPKALTLAKKGDHHVQSLRTIPVFKYADGASSEGKNPPISFAPQGIFEYKVALKKAIMAAEQYIYIEDGSYWSLEVMQWIREAVIAKPNLHVIMLYSSGAATDRYGIRSPILFKAINEGLRGFDPPVSMFDPPATVLNPQQLNRIALFQRTGDPAPLQGPASQPFELLLSANCMSYNGTSLTIVPDAIPAPHTSLWSALNNGHKWFERSVDSIRCKANGNSYIVPEVAAVKPNALSPVFLYPTGIWNGPGGDPNDFGSYTIWLKSDLGIGSKTILIDDVWAIIGSGSLARRTLYGDLNHAVSVLDPAGELVKSYRKALWSDHFDNSNPPAEIDDVAHWLNSWNPQWGNNSWSGNPVTLPAWLSSIWAWQNPVGYWQHPDYPWQKNNGIDFAKEYAGYNDFDARKDWGAPL